MPYIVRKQRTDIEPVALPQAVSASVAFPEMVGRNCGLEDYDPKSIKAIEIGAEVIAYASPDSTFAVTKKLFDGAQDSILIGIYDFSSPPVRQLVLDALSRGVEVTLMLDVDGDQEETFFNELVDQGVEGVLAPSCAHPTKTRRFFASSHEKVIVIDDEWCLVQSGNYSSNSIPFNIVDGGDDDHFRTGNRDTGLAVRSKDLAKFFAKILKNDIKLSLGAAAPEALAARKSDIFLMEAAPKKIPKTRFKSKEFDFSSKALSVLPVVSPDNYMKVVPNLLRAAKKSILIEQQYIRAAQSDISVLLDAIGEAQAANPDLDVRIVLGKIFSQDDLKKEKLNLEVLKGRGLKLGTNIRFINTDEFVHCHNKMVLIDDDGVLVSSQNWSNSAVSKNREAGLWFKHKGIAKYFSGIFENDWASGFKKPEDQFKAKPQALELPADALKKGGFVQVVYADYQEV
jgi:phosphatidylserine/phosphatidylglycerophosphate/cardiolipin synthase-like enzyme